MKKLFLTIFAFLALASHASAQYIRTDCSTLTLSGGARATCYSYNINKLQFWNGVAWADITSGGGGGGSGDVASIETVSVNNQLPLFSGTTGKVLQKYASSGILKAASGVVSAAASGTDYELPLTFNAPLSRSTNTISCSVCVLSSGNISQLAASTSAQFAGVASDETGSGGGGVLVFNQSPVIVTPTIVSFANAAHDHDDALGGGQLNATNVFSAGTVPTARLGAGTANNTTFLRGDQQWATPGGAGNVSGPAGATDGVPALFDGATGTVLKNSVPTGTGIIPVMQTSPTIITPTIASLVNANHNHSNAAGGGTLTETALATDINLSAKVLGGASPLVFEGATADAFETTFAVTDPTADRTVTFSDTSGTVLLGTGAANQVAVYSGANTAPGSSSLTWNGSQLSIGAGPYISLNGTITADRTVTVPDAASVTVQPSSAGSNQFTNGVNSAGVVQYAQPSFTNLSGAATDAQVPDNITLGANVLTSYIDADLIATPANPAAGKLRVYASTADGLICQKNSAGTITCIGGGAGGGDTITIGGAGVVDANFGNVPTASAEGVNCTWQTSGAAPANVSCFTKLSDLAGAQVSNLTLFDGANASRTLTFNTTGTDAVLTASSSSLDLTTGTLKQGGVNVVTESGAQVLTNKTLDAEGTGNIISIPFETWHEVAGCDNTTAGHVWNAPTANAPAPTCDTGTNVQKAYLAYDATTDESIQGSFVLPTGFTGAIDIKLKWKAAATTGSAGWCFQMIRVADGATGDPAFPAQAAGNCVSDAAKGTTLQENDATITNATCASCAAGDTVYWRLSRDADGGAVTDDMTGDAFLLRFGKVIRAAL